MRRSIAILILTLCFLSGKSQEGDYRARLKISGAIDKISVAFDESIWLGTRSGELYSTNSFDENWLYHKVIEKSPDDFSYDKFHKIVKFSEDIILIVGQVSKGGGYSPNSVVLSKDGGITWKTIKFNKKGTTQIHAIDYNLNGEVWISGGPAKFYYSSDFGQNWEEKTSPYDGSFRVYSIDMIDSNKGVICSQVNRISITYDNCKNWSSIETPFNQVRYERPGKKWEYTKVEKVKFFGKYLIAQQWGKVFFTDTTKINWRYLPHEIQTFSADSENGKLFTISKTGQIIVLDTQLEELYRVDKIDNIKDLQAINGKLFVLDNRNNIYRLDNKKIEKKGLYTEDHPIQTPQIIRKATFKKWGISGNHIYQSAYKNSKWRRVKVLNFKVHDFMLLNDNEAILWDGVSRNYYFNAKNDSISHYEFKSPIQDFLEHDIARITINGGSQGCFHSQSSEISFISNSKNNFVLDKKGIAKSELWLLGKIGTFESSRIEQIVNSINTDPYYNISISDFNISENDRLAYSKLIKKREKELKKGYSFGNDNFELNYFKVAVSGLDTVSHSTINQLLEKPEGSWSTTTNWFTVTLYNSKNEELTFSHQYSLSPKAWFLPWHVKLDNINFISKNLDFSQLINEMIPDNFMFKEVFSNKQLMYLLVEDQYSKSRKNTANKTYE